MARYFLFDNGSLEPASFKNLRRIANKLTRVIGDTIEPVSLLHSHRIDPVLLDGKPAAILEPTLRRYLQIGEKDFLLLPLFFGPSRALTHYLPERLAVLHQDYPHLSVQLAAPLVDLTEKQDKAMATILADRANTMIAAKQLHRPAVILVDHGTPEPAVNAVRNHLAEQLEQLLGNSIDCLVAASMERRDGEQYAFNDPLLEVALDAPDYCKGEVIVLQLFLSPGRHAGEGGDSSKICAAAQDRHPKLRIYRSELVGSHPNLIGILKRRLQAGKAKKPMSIVQA